MKLLFAIAHHFNPEGSGRHVSLRPDARPRVMALESCLRALHSHFGQAQCSLNLTQRRAEPVSGQQAQQVDVTICTTGNRHLLNDLSIPQDWYRHEETAAEPMMLPFECQRVLRDNLGRYDYYVYLEDDLILHDPWFFAKLLWFNQHTELLDLLQPNRFEIGLAAPYCKAYVDGDLAPQVAGRFQNIAHRPMLRATALGQPVAFKRPKNPHSGCFFLTDEQLAHWVKQAHFGDLDCRFVSPLESAATLGIMKTFRVYKPADPPGFLEVQHFGQSFLGLVGNKISLS